MNMSLIPLLNPLNTVDFDVYGVEQNNEHHFQLVVQKHSGIVPLLTITRVLRINVFLTQWKHIHAK